MRRGSAPRSRGEAADGPVLGVERVDLAHLDLAGRVVPDGGEGVDLLAIDLEPLVGPKGRSTAKISRGGLPTTFAWYQPVLLGVGRAAAGVELPGDPGGDATHVADVDPLELAAAQGTAHWRPDVDAVALEGIAETRIGGGHR
jgi:hypothetical protein